MPIPGPRTGQPRPSAWRSICANDSHHTLPESRITTRNLLRSLIAHASPVLIAQIASMSTAFVHTLVAAQAGTDQLAAVGVGAGLYACVMISLAGVLQALTPIAARYVGAGQLARLPACFQQAIWLALIFGVAGFALLASLDWLMHSFGLTRAFTASTHTYLSVLALGLPVSLLYRTCCGMLNALSQARVIMWLGVGNAGLQLVIAPLLALGWLGLPALGAVGCALANVAINALIAALAMYVLGRSARFRPLALLQAWVWPQRRELLQMLRMGGPMGVSSFVEVSCFSLIAVLVAPLGSVAVGAYRILDSFASLCFALPLSLSIALLAHVAQAAGAQDWALVRKTVRAGLLLSFVLALLAGMILWEWGEALIRMYTPDPAIQALAIRLIGLIALYQIFDTLQTVAAQVLRGLHLVIGPMCIHVLCFWGVGLMGGWLLCYRGLPGWPLPPMGLDGFWWAALLATMLACGMFAALLHLHLRLRETKRSDSALRQAALAGDLAHAL